MAYSAEPGRKAPYSNDLRWRVVWQRLAKQKSYREIANSLDIALGTVHNIWEKFVSEDDVSASKQPEREHILDDHHELLIIAILLEQPDIYLREICEYIHSATGTSVSESTICRVLKRHGYTRKKIRQVASQRCSDLRAHFMAEMTWFSVDKIVWLDETGSDKKTTIRKFGHSLRGTTPERSRLLVKGKRFSSVAARRGHCI